MDASRIFRVGLPVQAAGIVILVIAPAANLKAQLAMMGLLRRDSVKLGQLTLFTICADRSFPCIGIGNVGTWRQTSGWISAYFGRGRLLEFHIFRSVNAAAHRDCSSISHALPGN